MRNLCIALMIALFSPVTALSETTEGKRRFEVSDAIEMTTIVEPSAERGVSRSSDFQFSPDGRKFFIVTKQGNIEGNYNEFKLQVFDVDRVERFLTEGEGEPGAIQAAVKRSTSNRPGIGKARWVSDREIAFIGEDEGETAQVHIARADGEAVKRLTNHPTPVVDFDINARRDVVYAAISPSGWKEDEKNGVVLGVDILWDLWLRNAGESFYHKISFFGQRGRRRIPVEMSPYTVRGGGPHGMWISPDGRHAVSLIHVKESPDDWWTEYEPVAKNPFFAAAGAHSEFSSFTSEHREVFLQYVLIDLATGKMEPVFDAPAALYFGGVGLDAHWLDSRRVIIANTFLPLDGVDESERMRRRAQPAVVELDIASHSIAIIDYLPTTGLGEGAVSGEFMNASAAPEGPYTLTLVNFLQGPNVTSTRAYEKQGGEWRQIENYIPAEAPAASAPFELNVEQDLNTPANVSAALKQGQARKLLTDLNPQFDGLMLGEAEVMEWTTDDGRAIEGGLLLPPEFQDGKRYPLIIQTHGFNRAAFLVTGPGGSPSGFAARALANQGFVVLQTPDATPKAFRKELEGQMDVYRSAIKKLDDRGIVDPMKVGMHGWSRTGLYVQHAVVFSDLNLAAASASDPGQLGVFYHALKFGSGYPGMMDEERLIDVPLWGEGNAEIWAERDPSFNLHRVKTPLRIETYGRTLGGWWDVYSILRRHKRPIEYVYYPEGQHVLTKPKEQKKSQEGNVDWYRFWIKGEEDSDPSKDEQYERWRQLRFEATSGEASR